MPPAPADDLTDATRREFMPDMTAKGTLERLKAHLAKTGFGDILIGLAKPKVAGMAVTGALLLTIASPAEAQSAPRDSIDVALERCLAAPGGDTTLGMVDCTGEAIRAWDRRMNTVYQSAMQSLDPTSRQRLRAAQRQWLAFRAAERTAQQAPWSTQRGTLLRVELVSATLEAIRTRTSELQLYLP